VEDLKSEDRVISDQDLTALGANAADELRVWYLALAREKDRVF
jgi:hypothetical protein